MSTSPARVVGVAVADPSAGARSNTIIRPDSGNEYKLAGIGLIRINDAPAPRVYDLQRKLRIRRRVRRSLGPWSSTR
ncbi:hypothetical protein CN109_25970, partial [Sinorhizobium meliloti]